MARFRRLQPKGFNGPRPERVDNGEAFGPVRLSYFYDAAEGGGGEEGEGEK